MDLNKLTLEHKKLFNRFLNEARHELSVYSFENLYIWNKLFDISWAVLQDSLCIFFKDNIGCFLYLPPLSETTNNEVVRQVFNTMDEFNKNKAISRIENIEAKDMRLYESLGYSARVKSYDYVCLRSDLVKLGGNKFKSQRSSFNFFLKHYQPQYLPFSMQHRDGCLALYNCWRKQRAKLNQDRIYQGMQEDSLRSLEVMLNNFKALNLVGRVVKINEEIKAFTFGFKLNPDTFCIIYEITDLGFKGLAQFIFRTFSSELKDYKYINIMDDSGLENLKKVKLSYRPVRLVPAYIVKRHG